MPTVISCPLLQELSTEAAPEAHVTPDLDAIQSHISEKLARFKLPKKLILLPQLPRNTMGKVQKNALRDQFRDLFTKS